RGGRRPAGSPERRATCPAGAGGPGDRGPLHRHLGRLRCLTSVAGSPGWATGSGSASARPRPRRSAPAPRSSPRPWASSPGWDPPSRPGCGPTSGTDPPPRIERIQREGDDEGRARRARTAAGSPLDRGDAPVDPEEDLAIDEATRRQAVRCPIDEVDLLGNRSRVEDDKRTEGIEPRSDLPDASVDPTEVRSARLKEVVFVRLLTGTRQIRHPPVAIV